MNKLLIIILLIFIIFDLLLGNKSIENMNNLDNKGNDEKYLCRGKHKKNYLKNKFKIIKKFLSSDDCKYIIKYATKKVKRSRVMNPTGGSQKSNVRTSSHVFIKTNENDFFRKLLIKINDKVKELTGEKIPLENYESFQIVRYKPSSDKKIAQFYRQHYDACNTINKSCQYDMKRGGLRYLTFFIYLNTVDEGGETEFPNLDKKVKAIKGNATLWYNLNDSKTEREPCSLHAGASPKGKTKKWGINVWIRLNKFII